MKNFLLRLIIVVSKAFTYGVLLQTLFFSFLLAENGNAQKIERVYDVQLDLHLKNATILDVFHEIEAKTNFHFTFESSDISNEVRINYNKRNSSVADVLLVVSKEANLKFRQVNNYINVSKNGHEQEHKIDIIIEGITIEGKVVDENGEPLPGASVIIKGTNTGTVTDVYGHYKIDVPDNNTVLVFSYLGYLKEEIAVKNRTLIDVELNPDVRSLQEVTVIGYGEQSKAVLTNSLSVVDSKEIVDKAVVSFTEALAGVVPGVQVQQTTGAPGTGPVIKIRGIGSITGSSQPLYVIDGVPMDNIVNTRAVMGGWSGQQARNPLATINPNDIESITILKDASSTAIYGSRGSNGVVLITTKKGHDGKSTISLNVSQGWQKLAHKVDMMDLDEYVEMETNRRNWQWVLYGSGGTGNLDDPNSVRTSPWYKIPNEFQNPHAHFIDEDWQDEMFQVAPMTMVSLSASGGNKNLRYYVSGDYVDQDGIIINSGFKKYSMRANIDADISKKLRVGMRITPTFSNSNMDEAGGYGGTIAHGVLNRPPVFRAYNDDGTYNLTGVDYTFDDGTSQNWGYGWLGNPVAKAKEQTLNFQQFRTLASLYFEWDILKDLTFRSSISGDINYFNHHQFTPSTIGKPGTIWVYGYETHSRNINWVNENTLTYSTTFNEDHNFSVMGGLTTQKSYFEYSDMYADQFPNDEVTTLNAGTVFDGTQYKSEWSLVSLLARVTYDYKAKYLFTGTVRSDGSSRFGKDSRWGTFPSASVGWRVSEEPFLRDSKALSELKLRASYGLTGSNNIPNYGSYGKVGSRNYILGTGNGAIVNGLEQQSISNPLLHWEQTKEVDIGMELGFLNNRIYFNVDLYNSLTSGLLLNVPVPLITGFNSALQNIGSVRNKGLEVTLDTRIIDKPDFTWNANFNISFNRNVVESLGLTDAPIIVGPRNFFNDLAFITKVGEPIGSFYGLINEGVYMTQEEADNAPAKWNDKVGAGDMIFKDLSGPEGVPDGKIDGNDRTVIGHNNPDFIYGLTSTMNFYGVDFSFTLQGVQGATVMNGNFRNMYRWFAGQNRNYWKSEAEPGDGKTPKPGGVYQNRQVSTWWLEDASFLRIKNLTVGYTLPSKLFNDKIGRFRIYVNAQNLATFTQYPMYNPEVNVGEGDDYAQLTPGLDFGTYPIARTITIGLNLQF